MQRSMSITRTFEPSTIPVAISSSAAFRAFRSGSASIVSGNELPAVESGEHFGSRHQACSVLPDGRLSHTSQAETVSAAKKIDARRLVHAKDDFRRGRV